MGRCLLCGKEVAEGMELCETCKDKVKTEDKEIVKDVFASDSTEIRRERSEMYISVSPSDGKGWYILSAICGVLTVCFGLVFIINAFSENLNVIICNASVSASGTCFILCFAFFFFAQVIKRNNMQIYLQNDILKELSQIRSKLK